MLRMRQSAAYVVGVGHVGGRWKNPLGVLCAGDSRLILLSSDLTVMSSHAQLCIRIWCVLMAPSATLLHP